MSEKFWASDEDVGTVTNNGPSEEFEILGQEKLEVDDEVDFSKDWVVFGQPSSDFALVIPRILLVLPLSPRAYRLANHYLDFVARTGRPCFQGTRTLARKTFMSVGAVSNAKKELAQLGLLIFLQRGSVQTNDADVAGMDYGALWADTVKRFRIKGKEAIKQRLAFLRASTERPVQNVNRFKKDGSVGEPVQNMNTINIKKERVPPARPALPSSSSRTQKLDKKRNVREEAQLAGHPNVVRFFQEGPPMKRSEVPSGTGATVRGGKFKLTPPPGPEDFDKGEKTVGPTGEVKSVISYDYFLLMYRLCYMIDTEHVRDPRKLLGDVEHGKVAQTLKIMADAGADLTRLKEFFLWWAKSSLSKDRGSGNYRPPRPDEVRKYWGQALADRDLNSKGSLAITQSMEDRATEAKLAEMVMQRHNESRRAK